MSQLIAGHVLLFLIAPTAQSRILFTFTPPNQDMSEFGSSLACVGDVNSDGYPDIGISGWTVLPNSQPPEHIGAIHVFSGRDGHLIYSISSPNENDSGSFGSAVAGAGDITQDGFDDVIVGASWEGLHADPPYLGRAYVFSGLDGSVHHTLSPPGPESGGFFGCSVDGLGDVNGDSSPDVVVGANNATAPSGPGGAGRAFVFSGATGAIIHTLVSPNEQESGYFGYAVSRVADVDRDRWPDVLIGAPGEDPWGKAYILSGAGGLLLRTLAFPSEESRYSFGTSLADAGDVNSDGCSDVIIGAYRNRSESGPDDAGRAYVFSGADGSLIHELISPHEEENGYFGSAVAGIGDVSDDGRADVAVSAPGESVETSSAAKGRAYVFSGLDGSLLRTFVAPENEPAAEFTEALARSDDINRDGYDDLLIAAGTRVYAVSGALSPVELAFFEADVTGDRVVTRWRTDREYGCYGFEVFRQKHAEAERLLITDATIPGGGDWAGTRDYQYVDEVEDAGEYDYWLEVTATDGVSVEYGPIRTHVYPVDLALRGPYPNPVIDDARLELLVPEIGSGDVTLTLHDLAGRQVGGLFVPTGRCTSEMSWSASVFGVCAGVYQWRLGAGGKTIFKTMVVMP